MTDRHDIIERIEKIIQDIDALKSVPSDPHVVFSCAQNGHTLNPYMEALLNDEYSFFLWDADCSFLQRIRLAKIGGVLCAVDQKGNVDLSDGLTHVIGAVRVQFIPAN